MGKWHTNKTPAEELYGLSRSDCAKECGEEFATMVFGKRFSVDNVFRFIEMMKNRALPNNKIPQSEINDTIAQCILSLDIHTAFEAFGRPTYLVSKDLFDVCLEFQISSEDIEYAFETLPYPCFSFCIEKGCTIEYGEAREAKTVFVCKSGKLDEIIDRVYPNVKSPYDGILNRRTTCMFSVVGGISMTASLGLPPDEDNPATQMDKLVSALMLLWQSRPEFIVSASLSRSERYEFKGRRDNIRTWKFPDKLMVRRPSDTDHTPTGRHVRAHWRAGHFQHYRHERYSRNPDGSVKKTFIPPVIVNAGELETARGY